MTSTVGYDIKSAKDISTYGPNWCAGCGDFVILASDKNVTAKLITEHGWRSEDFENIGGIGCSAKEVEWLVEKYQGLNRGTYGFHTLHGRDPAVAVGALLANPNLHVTVFGGDGDLGAIGLAEFMHTVRKNYNLTIIFFDNQVYGLTKGQASPTAHKGLVTGSTPEGVKDKPIPPALYAMMAGATYVARAFSQKRKELEEILLGAMLHRGCSMIQVITPCVTYQREEGGKIRGTGIYKWWEEHFTPIQKVWDEAKGMVQSPEETAEYDVSNLLHAVAVELKAGEEQRWPLGLLYKKEGEPTGEENLDLVKVEKRKGGKESVMVHAPVHADISVAQNLPYYRKLIAGLR